MRGGGIGEGGSICCSKCRGGTRNVPAGSKMADYDVSISGLCLLTDFLTFFICTRATAAFVQAVLFNRPGSEIVGASVTFFFLSSKCLECREELDL